MGDTFFFFLGECLNPNLDLGFDFVMHECAKLLLKASVLCWELWKLLTLQIKWSKRQWSAMVTVLKVPAYQQWPGWYVMVYFLYFTPESRGLIALKATHILDKGIRTRLGSTRQGQVKDLCLSSIYLCCCAFGLRVVLCVTEHHLILASCEICSTLRMNL